MSCINWTVPGYMNIQEASVDFLTRARIVWRKKDRWLHSQRESWDYSWQTVVLPFFGKTPFLDSFEGAEKSTFYWTPLIFSISVFVYEKSPLGDDSDTHKDKDKDKLHLSSVSVCSCTRKVHLKTLSKLLTLVMVSFVSAAERINVQYAIYFLKRWTICNMQNTICNMQYAICNMQYTI